MLDEGFSPWLIEINSCPCMQPTTSVTARMCSQCLEDVIKGNTQYHRDILLITKNNIHLVQKLQNNII